MQLTIQCIIIGGPSDTVKHTRVQGRVFNCVFYKTGMENTTVPLLTKAVRNMAPLMAALAAMGERPVGGVVDKAVTTPELTWKT